MAESIWKEEGVWLKGNLHSHTSRSDGAQTPEEAIAAYEKAGYDFLAISDHNTRVEPKELSSKRLVLLAGEEISAGVSEASGGDVHILSIGAKEQIGKQEKQALQKTIERILELGGLAIVAHPYWSGVSLEELKKLDGCVGIEVFNSSCHFSVGKGGSELLWDGLLACGLSPLGFANDDCHKHFNAHRPNDVAIAWNMVKAKSREPGAILAALRAGRFYSSWGPEIKSFEIENGVAKVETSPAKEIFLQAAPGHGAGEAFFAPRGGSLTTAEMKLRGNERYLRVEAVDELGRKAWSNPVRLA